MGEDQEGGFSRRVGEYWFDYDKVSGHTKVYSLMTWQNGTI